MSQDVQVLLSNEIVMLLTLYVLGKMDEFLNFFLNVRFFTLLFKVPFSKRLAISHGWTLLKGMV